MTLTSTRMSSHLLDDNYCIRFELHGQNIARVKESIYDFVKADVKKIASELRCSNQRSSSLKE